MILLPAAPKGHNAWGASAHVTTGPRSADSDIT